MKSKVYFLPWSRIDDFPAWLREIGALTQIKPREFVALKIHFGEEGNHGYIQPRLVRSVAGQIKEKGAWPFLTDACTIYVGQRADAYHHHLVAHQHGFTIDNCGCPVIIADGLRGNSGTSVPVNLKHYKNVSVANAVHYADSLIFLNHFKGHEISGFGGALKNMGMGCGTRAGKYSMHDKVHPGIDLSKCLGCGQCVTWCGAHALRLSGARISFDATACVGCGECILSCPKDVFHIPWDENTSDVQEKIVEYAFGVVKNKMHFSVNFINHVTKYCDCYADRGNPLIEDIGVTASSDPVALDQASADLVNEKFGKDLFKDIFPRIDWRVQLVYAERLGLGSRDYELIR